MGGFGFEIRRRGPLDGQDEREGGETRHPKEVFLKLSVKRFG